MLGESDPDSVKFNRILDKVREGNMTRIEIEILIKYEVCARWVYQDLEDKYLRMTEFVT